MTHHLTCNCGRVLHVRNRQASCPTCEMVYYVAVTCRGMSGAEKRIAAAQLRGERLPEPEKTVTAQEGLK